MPADARTGARMRSVIAIIAIALIASLATGVTFYRLRVNSEDAYVGSTRPAALQWECWNDIFWTDPTNGVKWWAGPHRVITGRLVTAKDPPGATYSTVKHAIGSIHFDSFDSATFTSNAGGTVILERQAEHQAYAGSCEGGPED